MAALSCRSAPTVAASSVAAVLLAARTLAEPLGLELPGAATILAATGAGRSVAYQRSTEVVDFARKLGRPVGRPRTAHTSQSSDPNGEAVARSVLRFLMAHPGSVHGHHERRRYSDGFRRFVVRLVAERSELPLERFAACAEVPLGTLKSWLSAIPETTETVGNDKPEPSGMAESSTVSTTESSCAVPNATAHHIDTVLDAYARWHGGFLDFCRFVQSELGIRWGRDTLRRVLQMHGVRRPRTRPGRSPDELALRGAFQTFFPGAQWVGDGMRVPFVVDGTPLFLNFELQCDAFSGAFVGLSIRDQEDSAAVVESFADAVATTGAPPVAELLDNKPSNHTPDVDAALGDTIRLRATPGRPQNKAHVEGGFGLFSQTAPALELTLGQASPGQLAAQVLRLVTTTWARAINHRPRADRGGASRAQLYAIEPTDQQIAQARAVFAERRRQQDLAQKTLEARQRPDVLDFLDRAFQRLELLDPERSLRLAIARYPFDTILCAVSIFEGKLQNASLPDGVDARYLLGIVKNLQEQREGELFAEILLRERRRARDIILSRLARERDALLAEDRLPDEMIAELVDRVLLTEGTLEPNFWLEALADFVFQHPPDERDERYHAATQYIYATFAAPSSRRQHAVRFLAERLEPLG